MTQQSLTSSTTVISSHIHIQTSGYCAPCATDIPVLPRDGLCPYCAGRLSPPRTQKDIAVAREEAAAIAKLPLTEEGRTAMGYGVLSIALGGGLFVAGIVADGTQHLFAFSACIFGLFRIIRASSMRG